VASASGAAVKSAAAAIVITALMRTLVIDKPLFARQHRLGAAACYIVRYRAACAKPPQ
jgi:hypothetical protein